MVGELAQYVRDNPLDPTHLLEVDDLANLGVGLSFFPDPEHVIFPSGSKMGKAADQAAEDSLGQAVVEYKSRTL